MIISCRCVNEKKRREWHGSISRLPRRGRCKGAPGRKDPVGSLDTETGGSVIVRSGWGNLRKAGWGSAPHPRVLIQLASPLVLCDCLKPPATLGLNQLANLLAKVRKGSGSGQKLTPQMSPHSETVPVTHKCIFTLA